MNTQRATDAALIIESFEKKLLKDPKPQTALLLYRPMRNTEDMLEASAGSVSLKGLPAESRKELVVNMFAQDKGNLTGAKVGTTSDFQVSTSQISEELGRCLPCTTRMDNVLQFDISFDIIKDLQAVAQTLFDIAKQVTDAMLNPLEANLCSLLNSYKDSCVPDIQAIIALLKRKIVLLTLPDKITLPSFGALIGAIISPILSVAANLASMWQMSVMGSVQCSVAGFKFEANGDPAKAVDKVVTDAYKDVTAFLNGIINKFKSMTSMLNLGLEKAAKVAIEIPNIIALIKILVEYARAIGSGYLECANSKEVAENVARKAADNTIQESGGSKQFVPEKDLIRVFMNTANITDEEREALGLAKPLAPETLSSLVSFSDEIVEDKLVPPAIIEITPISIKGCEGSQRTFLDTSNIEL